MGSKEQKGRLESSDKGGKWRKSDHDSLLEAKHFKLIYTTF